MKFGKPKTKEVEVRGQDEIDAAEMVGRCEADLRNHRRELDRLMGQQKDAIAELEKVKKDATEFYDENRHNVQIRPQGKVAPFKASFPRFEMDQAEAGLRAITEAIAERRQWIDGSQARLTEAEHELWKIQNDVILFEIDAHAEKILSRIEEARALRDQDPQGLSLHGADGLFEILDTWRRQFFRYKREVFCPPEPPKPDPDKTTLIFTKSFPGHPGTLERKAITAYGAGEIAGFGERETEYLINGGFARMHTGETPPAPVKAAPILEAVEFLKGFYGPAPSGLRIFAAYGAGDRAGFPVREAEFLIANGYAERVPEEPEAA